MKDSDVANIKMTSQISSSARRDFVAGMANAAVLGILPSAAIAQNAKASAVDDTESKVNPALGEAWKKYHAGIETARLAIENTERFRNNPDHRAQAYYCLAEAQAMVYNLAIAPRLNHPLVYTRTSWLTHFYTLGGNSTDFMYGALFLDGKQTYRLTGNKGQLKLILMQVYNYLIGHPQSKSIGNYDFTDFQVKPDGSFEVILSATKHEGNWIRLEPESDYNFILLRRVMADWYDDPGTMDIAMTTQLQGYDEFSEQALAKRVSLAADCLKYLMFTWTIGFYEFCKARAGGKINQFALSKGVTMGSVAGSPTSNYALAVYALEPDEALLIEVEVPNAAFWQFQLYDVWTKSLDIMNNQTDIDMHRAVLDSDGKFRAVVSLSDPGIANWLDPVGRKEGSITFRNYRSTDTPTPMARVVKLAQLSQHLPADVHKVTPQQRLEALQYRRGGFLKLYGE